MQKKQYLAKVCLDVNNNGLSRDEVLKNIQQSLQPALKLEQKKSKSMSVEETNDIKRK